MGARPNRLAPLLFALVLACGDDGAAPEVDAGADAPSLDVGADALVVPTPPVIGQVPEARRFDLPGLSAPAHVVFTENRVPHVYAETREDAARVLGFVVARDRYFMMDMARRLATGTASELFGDAALSIDMESRGTGMHLVAARTLERFTDAQRVQFAAYGAGVDAYVDAVRTGRLRAPTEYMLAAPLVGAARPADVMAPFGVADVAAVGAFIAYTAAFSTADVQREAAAAELDVLFADAPADDLRALGAWDAFDRVTPMNGVASAGGWGLETALLPPTTHRDVVRAPALLSGASFQDAARRLARFEHRLGRGAKRRFGSNAWAAGGDATVDGVGILAGDGHLPLTIPALFYRAGLDTVLLGGGETRQVGLFLPGIAVLAVGTNGHVAWSQTQENGDQTDWYREMLVLDANGAPMASLFEGTERPLTVTEEPYTIADVPTLGSVGRTERWNRYETFDGRLITAMEGRVVTADTAPGPGETVVNVMGSYVIPEDTDMDGTVWGLSMDFTGLDGPNFALSLDAWAHARTVAEMRAGSGALLGYSQNIVAADASGSVLYNPYQAIPCRAHLRDAGGGFAPGGDPRRVIDGTRFGAFTVPVTPEGWVDEGAQGTDPTRCVVPMAEYPALEDPARGYVLNANNDPGLMAEDNDLENDPWYIGGPWDEDFRAERIDARLAAAHGTIDLDTMQDIQGDRRSLLADEFVPGLLGAIDRARTLAAGTPAPGTAEARLAALYQAAPTDHDDFAARLAAWQAADYPALSGVETFYDAPTAEDRTHAVGMMLFGAWLDRYVDLVLGDEGLPETLYVPSRHSGLFRMLLRYERGRGPGDPLSLPSYDVATEGSVFFDVRGTPEIETHDEVALMAVSAALALLRAEPTEPGLGGFGHDRWDEWLWGLRHHVRFESLLTEFLGDAPDLAVLARAFSITPSRLPLMPDLPETDPRATLPGFPRPCDMFSVDAADPLMGSGQFTYDAGPNFRMVIVLRGDDIEGENVIPGGQSGNPGSDAFDDQAALWLGNQTTPMRFTPESVVEGALEREVFVPATP